jgi:hypothetical protein
MVMFCYVVEAHGREIAYMKLPSALYIRAFEDPTDIGPYSRCGINFRQAFQAHICLANPDWADVDQVTVDHVAEPDQEKTFDKAFSERARREEAVEDFIYWVIPAEKPVRQRTTRSATRRPFSEE